MAVEVKISMFGDDFFRRKIQAMRYRAKNMEPVLRKVGEDWLQNVEEQFATEGARGHTPWAQLSRETKFHRGSSHPILVDKGDLLIEMTGPDNLDISDDSVTIKLPRGGEIETIAESHQYGFTNARTGKPVPARPMIVITHLDDERYRRWISDFLVNGRL